MWCSHPGYKQQNSDSNEQCDKDGEKGEHNLSSQSIPLRCTVTFPLPLDVLRGHKLFSKHRERKKKFNETEH